MEHSQDHKYFKSRTLRLGTECFQCACSEVTEVPSRKLKYLTAYKNIPYTI